MRVPAIGESVLFYPGGDRNAAAVPAIVDYARSDGLLNLCALSSNRTSVMTKPMTRHIDDPHIKANPDAMRRGGVGAWDYTAEAKRIDALEARLEELEAAITGPTQRKKSA